MAQRVGLNLNTILQAASEIADTKGINELTLGELARKLNVRTPSLYNHVNGLNDLREMLAIQSLSQLLSALTVATVGKSGENAVHAFGKAYVSFVRSHPGLYASTFLVTDSINLEIQKKESEIVNIALLVLNSYDLDGDEAIHVVRGLRSIFHGFASIEQKNGFKIELDLDESFHRIIDIFLAGINRMKQEHISSFNSK